jgi:hypothetical protein
MMQCGAQARRAGRGRAAEPEATTLSERSSLLVQSTVRVHGSRAAATLPGRGPVTQTEWYSGCQCYRHGGPRRQGCRGRRTQTQKSAQANPARKAVVLKELRIFLLRRWAGSLWIRARVGGSKNGWSGWVGPAGLHVRKVQNVLRCLRSPKRDIDELSHTCGFSLKDASERPN